MDWGPVQVLISQSIVYRSFQVKLTRYVDPLVMPMYALAILPLIHHVNHDIDQVWYADDATATGKITNLRTWWDKLVSLGPAYGYHVNASKTCLVAKQSHHAAALSAFHDTQITITAEGKPHLGAALGTFTFVQHYVKRKVGGWAQELNQ